MLEEGKILDDLLCLRCFVCVMIRILVYLKNGAWIKLKIHLIMPLSLADKQPAVLVSH